MKRCTYCGKKYPDDAAICTVDQEPLESVQPTPPKVTDTQFMTPQKVAQGKLSLGSFIKLTVIASIGCLPVLGVLFGVAFLIGLARGHHTASSHDFPIFVLWPLLLLKVITSAVSAVASGFFAGLCGYPFYAWLCRRRGGVILNGKFEVL